MAAADPPLLCFGLIADAQYANLPDGDTEGRCQRFREVPDKLRGALAALAAVRPAFVLNLGDIVNGNAAGKEACDAEFDLVARIFEEGLVSQARVHWGLLPQARSAHVVAPRRRRPPTPPPAPLCPPTRRATACPQCT